LKKGLKRPFISHPSGNSKNFLMENAKTQSDELFETYLNQRDLHPDYEPSITGKSKCMDFRFMLNDQSFFFEVEEFQKYPIKNSQESIRNKINEALGQFKQYKEYCCSLVLCSPNHTVGLSPDFVLGAMLGNVCVAWEAPSEPALPVVVAGRRFGSNGKMRRRHWSMPQNTSFSALIIVDVDVIPQWRAEIAQARLEKRLGRRPSLEEVIQSSKGTEHLFQDVARVVVFENPDARMPLPRVLFVGPYDERWGCDGDSLDIVRVFAGTGILQLESEGDLGELSFG
jgi:hypothetical protein